MIRRLRRTLLALLSIPDGPPPLPLGTSRVLVRSRADRGYLYHQLTLFGFAFLTFIGLQVLALADVTVNVFGKEVDILETTYDLPFVVSLVLTTLAFLVKYAAVLVDYDLRYYIVTDRNIRIRQGAVVVQEATYTFANVQNVRIEQGPLERLFGISTLKIQTAGGGGQSGEESGFQRLFQAGPGHEGIMRGIANPVELRDEIQRLVRLHRDSGLGDPDDSQTPAESRSRVFTLLESIRDELRGVHAALRPH